MKNVLLIAPTGGNGGINSWTRNYLRDFKSEEFNLISIDSSLKHRLFSETSSFKRIYSGLLDLIQLRRILYNALMKDNISIMHTTTSGSFGMFRDYILGTICKKMGIKTILHCRYGNIPKIIYKRNFAAFSLIHIMSIYDQIWVLDSNSLNILNEINKLKNKIYLIPNCVEVPTNLLIEQKDFKRIAFIANLVPSKGLFELINAVIRINLDVELSIIGPGSEEIVSSIKTFTTNYPNKIKYHGAIVNEKIIEFLKTIDILALPTYYESEAFPISILEAMSQGKLVISTERSAIPDMLTSLDGTPCGILVKEKDVESIKKAIEYCIYNPEEANQICKRAYNKALKCYSTDIIYQIYIDKYRMLTS